MSEILKDTETFREPADGCPGSSISDSLGRLLCTNNLHLLLHLCWCEQGCRQKLSPVLSLTWADWWMLAFCQVEEFLISIGFSCSGLFSRFGWFSTTLAAKIMFGRSELALIRLTWLKLIGTIPPLAALTWWTELQAHLLSPHSKRVHMHV